MRGGYGIYYGRTSISDSYQFILDEPFEISQTNSGTLAALGTFQNPWTPGAPSSLSSYPNWVPRTPNSTITLNLPAPKFESPMVQQYTEIPNMPSTHRRCFRSAMSVQRDRT